jgi:DNA polymerase III epsilon subunit-like protein
MNDNDWIIVLDLETTGLNYEYNMICEIGICFLNLKSGEIDPIFNIICKERDAFDRHAWIFYNSSLKAIDVSNGPYLEEFRTELQEILNLGYPVTAYNQDFDFTFLSYRNFNIPNRFWDAMLKLTNIMKLYHSYYGYKFPSVQEAWYYFFPDEKKIEPHRALDDAMMEARIIFETNKILENKNG